MRKDTPYRTVVHNCGRDAKHTRSRLRVTLIYQQCNVLLKKSTSRAGSRSEKIALVEGKANMLIKMTLR